MQIIPGVREGEQRHFFVVAVLLLVFELWSAIAVAALIGGRPSQVRKGTGPSPDVFCGKRIYGRICHTQKGAEDMEQTYVPFPLLQVEDVELVLELFL